MISNPQKTGSLPQVYSENSIKIDLALTPAEKKEIYRFRYQVYIEEMAKHVKEADYSHRLLFDDMDDWALLLSAKTGSTLIGTARINIGQLLDFPSEVREYLSLNTFQAYYSQHYNPQFCFITKIMVAPAFRSSPVFYLLMAKCYELCCRNQIQFVFGICNYHLIRLYEKMGLHRYGKNFALPGYGLQVPIVLLVNDIPHLRAVRSPLFRIARKIGSVDTQPAEWFHTTFTRHSPIVNSQIVTEPELWSVLSNRLAGSPREIITILRELTIPEAKKFLYGCSSLLLCDPENIITTQGDVSYSCTILLAGRLKSLTFRRPSKEYALPGQPFGANGLTAHNIHQEDIMAATSAEILVLSGLAFQRFYHAYPEIAHKVTQKITGLTKI